ncbi:acyl-CoA thioesterase [Nonlabens sp. Ci31]|nr:acyl-CoA thioesterase [Nonlabens sp. Ci31]
MICYCMHMIYIYVGANYFWKKVVVYSDLTRLRRVRILDCESLRYVANSKYFYYMDFIRFEILFRTQLYKNTMKKGLFPVIGSQKFIYKKPLKRWTKLSITLPVEAWNEKWVYHTQTFKQKGEVYAVGFTKVAF